MTSDAETPAPAKRRRLAALLRRPWVVAGLLATGCAAIGAAISLANWPVPRVHDEFSYLLAADTFAHGRLANPTHPQWQHLETFHVIQQPSYASKYPPGQGGVLALGQFVAGQPLVAVWALSGLAAAATYWMLLGWTSPRFAALGGILWLAHPGFQLAWGQSYWGGTLAYLGGALVFGAALRMQRRTWVRDATAMATGALVLAVSRPFEGFVFCAATGAWLIWHWIRAGWPPKRNFVAKLVLPMAGIFGLGGAGLGAYHAAVTGDPFTFPYAIHESTYGRCPMFVGQSPAPKPSYRHAAIDDFHSGWELDFYRRQSTIRGWWNNKLAMSWLAGEFFLTPAIMIGVLLARPWRWRRLTPAAVVAAVSFAATWAVMWYNPHYLAPFAPLLILAAVAGLRRLDVWTCSKLHGMRLAPALVALQVALFAVTAIQFASSPRRGWFTERAEIVDLLRDTPDRHLILVRYGSGHVCHDEWVFNEADVDGSKIVWARAMDPASDAELMRYFGDRQAWLLEPEARRLVPLPRDAAELLTSGSLPSVGRAGEGGRRVPDATPLPGLRP